MTTRRWISAAAIVAAGCGDATRAGDDSQMVVTTDASSADEGDGSATMAGPGDADADAASTPGDSTGSGGEGDDVKFDLGVPDVPRGTCQAQCGEIDFSYIWIANSSEHTLSKINTRTLVEEGRYQTRPDASGNPSRTSVSIDGRAVAVANRMGGLTKIWARAQDCEDKNADGMIQTSSGPGDVLPFAQDECVAWHTPFPAATTQRPVAWTSGTFNDVTCEFDDQKVWTAAGNGTGGTWPCDGSPGIFVYRVDGETGVVEDELHMPDVSCGTTLGPYGAAVDYNNDLWMYIWSAGTIVHVEYDTLDYETLPGGAYGITVDTEGRVWTDAGWRYDPATATTAYKIGDLPGSGGSGVAQDLQGRIWTATAGGVGWIDMETMQVGDTVLLPEGGLYRGIAVDFDGYIWAVMLSGNNAHKIDPETYAIETVTGLNGPYTYSDMSGGQLTNVTCNAPAG